MKYKVFTKIKKEGFFSQSEFSTNDKNKVLEYVEKRIDVADDDICIHIKTEKRTEPKCFESIKNRTDGSANIDITDVEKDDEEEYGDAPLMVAKKMISYLVLNDWHFDKRSDEDRVILYKGKTQVVIPVDNSQSPREYAEALDKIAMFEGVSRFKIARKIFGEERMNHVLHQY